MSTTSVLCDPLSINLHRQTKKLLSIIPNPSKYETGLLSARSNTELLATLSRLLSLPAFTIPIATLFRPILFDLCARWLDNPENSEEHLIALCLLLENHEELFPILYRIITSPRYREGPLDVTNNLLSSPSVDVPRLQRLLLAYYRLLGANRELPRLLLWPLLPLTDLIWNFHLDNAVKLLAIRCYAVQSGMGEAEREVMEREVLGELYVVDCQMEYGSNTDGSIVETDGWIMPVTELQRIRNFRRSISQENQSYYTYDDGEHPTQIELSELSPHTVDVHGVFLLGDSGRPHDFTSHLVSTPTTIEALQSLALHLSLRVPTLLTSPPSSGKSLFLSHLAELIHPGVKNQIIIIHLADTSLDPRALLGSYVSSPAHPGSFEWKEGVLVRAMREGKWIVFEDIDRGSSEVLGVIKPLVESLKLGKWVGGRASLEVPSRGSVTAADSFALFATRSTSPSRSGTFTPPTFFGAHKFHEIIITLPSHEELRTILDSRFPRLAGNATLSIIRLWEAIKSLGSAASTRDVGLRELEKFCLRVEKLLPASSSQSMDVDMEEGVAPPPFTSIFPNPVLREDIYLEARDVFFGAGALTSAAQVLREAVAQTIADHLGLDADRRSWVLHGRTPDLDLVKDVNGVITSVRIGHTHLLAHPKKLGIVSPSSRPFAMHKPAMILLSRIGKAVSLAEPILLTGETGTGKTSVVTHLASLLRRPLTSLNLSHQTETSDLLGGFKPVDARLPGAALQQRFLDLFGGTFSRRKNEKFEMEVRKAVTDAKWKRVVGLWKESSRLAKERIQSKESSEPKDLVESEAPRKRRKVEQPRLNVSADSWAIFIRDVEEFDNQYVQGKGKFAFSFVEGPLVKALRSGGWVLLDEINLATPETLECISGLLHSPTASITLTEQGSLEPVPRHPDFRLFACMNPATDVGKKDLPANIRSRFTEIDVPPVDSDMETLLSIISQYIGAYAVSDKGAIMNVAEFYMAVKDLVEKRQIADGSNHRPQYSMRTLARALTFASDTASTFGLRRAIWEGCLMAFTMVLDEPSTELVTALAHKHLLNGVRNVRSMLTNGPQVPHSRSADEFVKFGPFYLEKGPLPDDPVEDYIMTPSVEAKLINLARIILTRQFPILIEGPTSSGKTSAVEYLAKRTGHRFIRINNHEHTDIQEYIGSYVSDPQTGKLVFKDGLLVRALRGGDWVVLDELNLAPTDVLEALNRLLDDNRELVIPETQEVVKPHPHFMLFAAQNPPGLYAGRKVLSRAFRNRFLEVHFEDVPQGELETILHQRCRIAPSYAKRIVSVFHELQKRRQSSRVFESKQGFATLRDLFRWAGRDAVGYQELAENGYMLLAERARKEDDKTVVKEVIESIMNVKIDESIMYNIHRTDIDILSSLGCPIPSSPDVIWTSAMQRLFTLVSRALRSNEPVLLVGETGAGKTSVCQLYADATARHLHGLNCHQNTETADLIGGLRPVRYRSAKETEILKETSELFHEINSLGISIPHSFENLDSALKAVLKLDSLPLNYQTHVKSLHARLQHLQSIFEWHDGPLIEAMRNGDMFLLDEISLADDSVLERLNSVLEPARTIVLAEKGGGDEFDHPAIQAHSNFQLVATMNPGGDYGKKELSPALRNRFTEIWVPRVESREDLELIVGNLWKHDDLKPYTTFLLDFVDWLGSRVGDRSLVGLRDILAWVNFSNAVYCPGRPGRPSANSIFHHAAHMTFLDGLNSLPQLSSFTKDGLQQLRDDALFKLVAIAPFSDESTSIISVSPDATAIQFGPFSISRGTEEMAPHMFNLQAPTTRNNALRVIRACQVLKPILLEGSPGVGKTSLISALANISGHELCRINLSDQTDLIDLFGSDLPVENGGPGEFAWKDAEFLRALQEGRWVLLDEMNLAPQAVLEGLNAVLDHRGTVYIPELGRSFVRHPSFRIFAAQNPLSQGGGRKGLPKSFVNRFTKVYIDELSPDDLFTICQQIFPDFDDNIIHRMISFNIQLQDVINTQRRFGREGSPWEFNLRDVIRWGCLLRTTKPPLHPSSHFRTVYLYRFRTDQDRIQVCSLYNEVFKTSIDLSKNPPHLSLSPQHLQIGLFVTERRNMVPFSAPGRILRMQIPVLESLSHCVSQSWLAILTGHHNSGKSNVVRVLAHFTGNTLQEISINGSTDTMDILGGFEQVDVRGRVLRLVDDVVALFDSQLRSAMGSKLNSSAVHRLRKADEAHLTPHQLLQIASSCLTDLQESSSIAIALQNEIGHLLDALNATGRFEWVDGPLIRAMKLGHWVLMDGANLCNPSVLDRLNSLCEENGVLTLSERGYVKGKIEILKPHSNFRLFMTVNPQYGELSRAMRNRGIEISLIAAPTVDDSRILCDYWRLPPILSPIIGNHKSDCVQFEAARRGLCIGVVTTLATLSTSGRALDQQSTLSSLVDQGPMIVTSYLTSSKFTNAHLLFVTRTTPTVSLQAMGRLLAKPPGDSSTEILDRVRALMNMCSNDHFTKALVRLRTAYSLSQTLPSDLILYQPMDFYLTAPPCTDKKLERGSPSTHQVVLQVLELFVGQFLDAENQADFQTSAKHAHQTERTKQVLQQVSSVLSAIYSTSQSMLEALAYDANAPNLHDLTLTSLLLSYGCHLRRITSASLDFSALQATCQWIVDAVKDNPPSFKAVITQAAALQDVISHTTGLGLIEIWTSFFINRPADVSPTSTKTIDHISARLNGNEAHDFRQQAFSLMALQDLSMRMTPQMVTTLTALQKELEFHLHRQGKREEQETKVNPCTLIAELGIFCSPKNHQASTNLFSQILEIACGGNGSLYRMVPYQHLLWVLQAGHNATSITAQVHIQWLNALWNTSTFYDLPSGPSILLQPTQLMATITTCDWTRKSLHLLEDYQAELSRYSHLLLLTTEKSAQRIDELASFLLQSIVLVTDCFADTFPSSVDAISRLRLDSVADLASLTGQMLELLGHSNNKPLKQAIERYLRPSLQHFHSQNTEEQVVLGLGTCWVNLGMLVMDLFVPDIPIDPAAIQNYTTERWREEKTHLQTQLGLHQTWEELMTGYDHSDLIDYLKLLMDDLTLKLSTAPSRPHRNDVSRLAMFWSEVTQFQNQVVSRPVVDKLLESLESGGQDAILREEVFQKSTAGFCQRLSSAYAEYSDLSCPILLAIHYVRMGLRIIAHSSTAKPSALITQTSALVSFPAVRSSATMCAETETTDLIGVTPIDSVLLTLSAASLEWSLGSFPREALESTYKRIFGLWLIDRAKEKGAEKAASSLYRHKNLNHDDLGEAEMEEHEFLSMFPSFEGALEAETDIMNQGSSPTSVHVPAAAMGHLVSLHYSIFGTSRPLSSTQNNFRETRKLILASSIPHLSSSLPDSLDDESLPFQLHLLHDRLSRLKGDYISGRTYNFYADANIPEAKKAVLVLFALQSRLDTIIQEWPDQMVLHHLKSRCNAALGLDLHSPIAKILSALEQLLLQTQDWEIYANRENTLKSNQHSLIELIVHWRRLELSCWQGLLNSQLNHTVEGVNEWWFRLYDVTFRGALDACEETDQSPRGIEEYLNTLVPLLDDFIRASPLGEFNARMDLLQSFEAFIQYICNHRSSNQRHMLARIQRILHSTIHYYSLFSGQISVYIQEQREILEKEIHGLIKLASWKDINVQALKASAQRSHHQLYKIIRKFRDILRLPVLDRLKVPTPRVPEAERCPLNIPASKSPQIHSVDGPEKESPDYSVGSSKVFKKFDIFLSTRIRSFIYSKSPNVIDGFAADIIVTTKELSEFSAPLNLPADRRKKQQKALLVRKRKAWNDLLKELKRVGFSTSVKPDILRQNADSRWLREQPIIHELDEHRASTLKSEVYFARLYGSLPSLRSSLSKHHNDLTTRELQRAIMFLESGFSMGIELRTRLATTLDNFHELEQMVRRLQMLSSHPMELSTGANITDHVHGVGNVLSKLSNALQEILDGIRAYNSLKPDTAPSESLQEEVNSVKDLTVTLRLRFAPIIKNLEIGPLPVLLKDDNTTLLTALNHFSETSGKLRNWAENHHRFRYLFRPVSEWLAAQTIPPLLPSRHNTTTSDEVIDTLLNSLMITVQNFLSKCPEATPDNEDDNDRYISDGFKVVCDFTHMLNLELVMSHLQDVFFHIVAQPSTRERDLQHILPFLGSYISLAKDQLVVHSHWTKAIFKLCFVLCSVISSLSMEGFCQPPDTQESDETGDTSESTGGVGLGEGSGMTDVSKEIEDESQIEGLKGDDEAQGREKDPRNSNDESGAIEMSEDFGGELEDVPDSGTEDEANSGDESGDEREEKLGDLDPSDPSAVDEKLWGDEKGPQDEKQDEKTNQDHSKKDSGEAEVVAKEGQNKNQSKEDTKEANSAEGQPSGDEDETPPVAEEPEEANSADPNGAPMDEFVQEANTLDLPDDIDLGGKEPEMDSDDVSDDMRGDEEVAADDSMEDVEPDQQGQNTSAEQLGKEDHPVDDSNEPTDQDLQEPNQPQETGSDDELPQVENEAQGAEAIARPDVSAGNDMIPPEGEHNPEVNEHAETGHAGGSGGVRGQDTASEDSRESNTDLSKINQVAVDTETNDSNAAGAAPSRTHEGQTPALPGSQPLTNPLRSIGDALNEIRQRFDDIISGEQRDAPQEKVGDIDAPLQVEYLQPDDADHDMEALGPAGEEQVAKLNELKLVDGDEQLAEMIPMDLDLPLESKTQQQQQQQPSHEDSTTLGRPSNVQDAVLQGPRSSLDQSSLAMSTRNVDDDKDAEEVVELELRSWQTLGFPDAGAEKIWRMYESLTHDLAYALCEQLRLILEPTLATRLKGDYRTGKRLNMKKIISYIASDYTKDKIWLRRTKPSQREYQVLIAIDDSRSMAESHSVHLAYQTLALVSKALSRLEAGDIAIAKFGETVEMLHGFHEGPFTDQSGIQVMSAFRFNQKATNVYSLLQTSLKVLETARERHSMSSATAADLWQLQFIISDGMCQDHELLKTLLRKAEEQRVMIVFVIVDSLHGSSETTPGSHHASILTMDKAEFKNVDGRMELQLQKYLDSFPFEYYVVLRNVEALPEVLASTLKQFFERISDT